MTDAKLCPMRFKEFADVERQACIGERCMWLWKCNGVYVNELESKNSKLSSDELYWRTECAELKAELTTAECDNEYLRAEYDDLQELYVNISNDRDYWKLRADILAGKHSDLQAKLLHLSGDE